MPVKNKKPRLKKVSTIRHNLHSLWSLAVRERAEFKCELCGLKKGDIGPKGKEINKLDAHHFLSKEIKNCPLKFEILNGVCVCPFCHKFGIPSFHRDPIRTIKWLQENRPERYEYVLNHADIRVDLDNRDILAAIEKMLINKQSLNLNELQCIEDKNPRKTKKPKFSDSLFKEGD